MNDEQLIEAFVDLLKQVPGPETPEEIDAELRAAGLDPERIRQRTVALIQELKEKYTPLSGWTVFKTRLRWYIKQALPLHYESKFREGGKPVLCLWQMWMGRCFNVRSWILAE